MLDVSLPRLCGVFALLSATTLLATIAIGIALGGEGPAAIDFGDPATLQGMAERGHETLLLESLALLAPALGLGAALGWRWLVPGAGSYIWLGILAWYTGTVITVLQDAMELALASRLPEEFASGTGPEKLAVLAAGAASGEIVKVLMLIGDLIAAVGTAIVAWALYCRGGRWRILGILGILSVALSLPSLLVPALVPLRLMGFLLFLTWFVCLGVAMLRLPSDLRLHAASGELR